MTQTPWFPRVLPFGLYMAFILIQDLIGRVLPQGPMLDHLTAWMYPVKIIVVIAALIYCWKSYDEIDWKQLRGAGLVSALGVGVLVFVLWINMDWDFAVMGGQTVYDPTSLPGGWLWPFVAVRLLGAAVVVPIFEEIFWRSFILRYIVNPEFTTVAVGTFTWVSFLLSAALFGAEHHLWLAGIVAGLLYNLLCYKTRSISLCIVSHGVTNLLLGIYVLMSSHWKFW